MNHYTKSVQIAVEDPGLVSLAEDTNDTFFQSMARLVEQRGGWDVDVINWPTREDHVTFRCQPEQVDSILVAVEELKGLYT